MTDVLIGQGGVYALLGVTPPVRAAQGGVQALLAITPAVRAAQGGIQALVAVTPEVPVAQAGMYALAEGNSCGTRLAQIWTITRNDGEVFRFTSKDNGLDFGGQSYRSCDSLVPTATENVAVLDSAGTMDLSGALGTGSGAINSWDLYAGRFDGATVEAWLVAWDGFAIPKRLLKGTWGNVTLEETGFSVELVGDGEKLQQTPLVFLLQPGCRWKFGDPVTCQKDLGPLTVTGTIDSGDGLRDFTDAARSEAAGYFNFGRVTFTSGLNSGASAEIKSHEAGGVFTLWPRVPFPIVAGDQYSMTPGCTNLKAAAGGCNGCTAWGQLVRYGGFDKVPTGDKRSAAATVRGP